MKIQSLGHVVIRVSNQAQSEAFYNGILGLPIVARMTDRAMTFFSLGNHHDFAIAALGDDAPEADKSAVGLAHVAFKIGDDLKTLKAAQAHLNAAGVQTRAVDHGVSQSLYFADPDGNGVEVYIDASDIWKREPQAVANSQAMVL
jgi:catechol 2,3-dioxygenase